MTSRRTFAHRFHLAGWILYGIGVACWMVGVWFGTGMASVVTPEQTVDRPHAEGSAAALAEEHGCWTGGEAPTDPTHVVVTIGDDIAPTYGGKALTDKALDQLFAGKDHGLTVHAFCP